MSVKCPLQHISSNHAVVQGSVYQVRPVMMTVVGRIVGLFLFILSSRTDSRDNAAYCCPYI